MPHAIRLNRFRTEHGATMLEATFCILFVLFCIGAVIDLGLGLWQYNFLNYTTTRAAREGARECYASPPPVVSVSCRPCAMP